MNILTAKWPFYVSGPLLALLLAGSLCLFGDPVGLTAAMTAMTEYCDSAVAGQSLPDAPAMDWQLAMLFGLFFGALIAAASGGNFKLEFFDEESGSFTVKTLRTVLGGVAGGFLVMLGVQLAGDTVWGQWGSAIQLSSGAWIFLVGMVLTGSTLAILLERRGESGGGKTAAPARGGKRRTK